MGIRKLDIMVVLVRDWSAAVSWYEEKLGLSLVYREDDDQWCVLSFPEGEARLALLGDKGESPLTSRFIPDIEVDDLAATVRELEDRGVRFKGGIRGGDEGYRIITFLDLEDNELQLFEWV